VETVSVSGAWRVMAERMAASWTAAPHFFLTREVIASGLVDMRARMLPAVERRVGVRLTYTDLLVKLLASALQQHPRLNARYADGVIQQPSEINVGIATATDDGLIVPVIRTVDSLGIGDIAARRRDLVERAEAGRLSLADIEGGTFTLTNLGMFNVDAFNAIVNPPQAAILAVGAIVETPVIRGGELATARRMGVTLACDHRILYGADGAEFLARVRALLEEPLGLAL
jgi:pyruvate dehydrogenase E2 component (dihydrolipoamide acetyltransferase)